MGSQDPAGVGEIEPQELYAKRAELVVIDVRRPDEFTGELGHVPGSELIVLDTLPQRLDEIPRGKPVVFVCLSGGRSARAAAFALANGFEQVFNLKGGMQLWNALKLPTEGRSEG